MPPPPVRPDPWGYRPVPPVVRYPPPRVGVTVVPPWWARPVYPYAAYPGYPAYPVNPGYGYGGYGYGWGGSVWGVPGYPLGLVVSVPVQVMGQSVPAGVPPVVAYVERGPDPEQPPAPGYWYWCDEPEGWFPQVGQCPGGWQPVAPSPEN